jgi:TorA maturation chaperone TorD
MRDAGLESAGASRGIGDAAQVFATTNHVEIPAGFEQPPDSDDIALARANEYRLLASVLANAPSPEMLARMANISGDATRLGRAHAALAEAAANTDAETVAREYFALFVGVGRGELLPYASYYLTGFLQERPLAQVREEMAAIGLAGADHVSEPEDHIAILCEVMGGMAAGDFEADLAAEQRFFERNLKPWASRFFADLEGAASARFYRNVGRLGRLFMEIEAEGFAMLA